MKIIISPAKKMRTDPDTFLFKSLPYFLPRTEMILEKLRSMSYEELKALWKCNEQIAKLNAERLKTMNLRRGLTPAILAYEGIQYQYMAPGVFSRRELDYLEEHLRILSGFYGILKPFDGVTPYRLEMQAKLSLDGYRDLYGFWGNSLAESLFSETDQIINLASKEYSQCVSRFLRDGVRLITCIFGELAGEKVIEKGTMCKMARGEMVRFLAEHQITDTKQLKAFDRLGYHFSTEFSSEDTFVFIKGKSVIQKGGEWI